MFQSLTGARQAFDSLSGSAYSRLDALMADDFGRMRLGFADAGSSSPNLQWSGLSSLAAKGFEFDSQRVRNRVSLFSAGGRYVTHVSSDGVNADVETRFVGSGVGYRAGRFSALAGVTAAWHDVAVGRAIKFPGFSDGTSSRFTASTYRLDAEGSYALTSGRVRLAPYAGYSHIMLSSAAFGESGGVSALRFERDNRSIDQVRAGLRANGKVRLFGATLTPHLDASMQRSLGDVMQSRGAAFISGDQGFDSVGTGFNQQSVDLDAGVDLHAGPVIVTGRYRAQFGNRWKDRSAVLSAALRF
jgi:uncharacterized protein with beta-barrel porin domain